MKLISYVPSFWTRVQVEKLDDIFFIKFAMELEFFSLELESRVPNEAM